MWTVHFQYSSDILFENNYVFNPNNATFEAPNGDGIDMNSCKNAVVRNNVIDVGDDAMCVKSGADWLGRRAGGCNASGVCVGRPTENILWTDNEVRNGHGLTLGSDASGGVRNVTFRNIFLNGLGGPQAPGKRGCIVGGPHFKTQRGRGGVWEDITWDNIYGVYASGIGFQENHGGTPAQDPPTNASATPVIRNLTVKNVVLSALGPSLIATLAESPIENLVLSNITLTPARHGAKVYWQCPAAEGTKQVNKLFATGKVENVSPPLGSCSYPTTSDAAASVFV
jgi:polygalacturonase